MSVVEHYSQLQLRLDEAKAQASHQLTTSNEEVRKETELLALLRLHVKSSFCFPYWLAAVFGAESGLLFDAFQTKRLRQLLDMNGKENEELIAKLQADNAKAAEVRGAFH